MKTAAGLLLRISPLIIFLAVAIAARAGHVQSLTPPGLADGAGIWVNLWHWPDGDLDAYCSKLRANGIRNIFLQTSRSNTEALPHPEKLGPIIETCHRYHIRVLAWSFAELDNPPADAAKLITAARFQTPHGQRMDGIAGNMEKNLDKALVETYSKLLREALGQSYPMVAVVYSPLNRAPAVAHIPWPTLAQYWDVIAPMTYWGGRHQKLDPYTYTAQTAQKVRALTGKPDVEIHLIGDGMGTTSEEVQQFLKACGASDVASASLYPNHLPTAEQFACLGRYQDYFQSNSRFRLAAFRELVRAGVISNPPKGDPSKPISRDEFYQLVARQLFQRNPADPIDGDRALEVLDNAGVLPADLPYEGPALEQALAQPVGSVEALSLIASSIEFQSANMTANNAKSHNAKLAKRRADRWLVQPAHAEPTQPQPAATRSVNYLDAAQMVLQARAGLK
jgi:hypothetical protein